LPEQAEDVNDPERLEAAETHSTSTPAKDGRVLPASVLEQAPVALFVVEGPDLVFRFANARYRAFLPGLDLIGQPVRTLFPELESQGIPALLEEVYRTGEPRVGHAVPVQYAHEGTMRTGRFDFTYTPLRDPEGSVAGVIATVSEVTKEAEAEEALRESEARYRTFLALSSEGVWRFDTHHPVDTTLPAAEQVEAFYREGVLAECNVAFARMYGYERPEELVGTRLPDMMPQDDPRNVAYLTAFVEAGYRLSGVESYELDREGRPRVFENAIVGEVQDGFLVRAWGTQRDVTERVWAEEARRESEARFRAVFENATVGLVLVSDEGYYLDANPAFCTLVGRPREAVVGQPSSSFIPPEMIAARDHIREELAQAGRWQGEFPLVRPDGVTVHAEWSVATYPMAGVRLAAAMDVTARRTAEAALREFNATLEARVQARTAELERSNRDLQSFAQVASHDLQEPLRKIQSFADLLQQDHAPALDEDGQRYVARIRDAAARMNHLMHALLGYARVATKARPFEPVDLGQTLATVHEDVEVRLRETGGRVEVSGPLPTVEGDPVQMHQLLLNLIGNALKFHREGVPPVVRVQAVQTRRHVQLVVEDNGIGFDARFADRIFEPFHRLQGRGQYEGSGMGLAIVRRIVERHGGTITAESTPGEGSRFTLVLPTTGA
jgi:PAS domain S-box-containing protein